MNTQELLGRLDLHLYMMRSKQSHLIRVLLVDGKKFMKRKMTISNRMLSLKLMMKRSEWRLKEWAKNQEHSQEKSMNKQLKIRVQKMITEMMIVKVNNQQNY